jgi:hypothetical protein
MHLEEAKKSLLRLTIVLILFSLKKEYDIWSIYVSSIQVCLHCTSEVLVGLMWAHTFL